MTGQPVASDDPVLDAARACILAVGWRRTTLTDIARRAGTSRMTLYRRWGDRESILADLVTREWADIVLTSGLVDAATPAPDTIARGLAGTVTGIRDNELFHRLFEVDPEFVLPYLFQRLGRTQRRGLELLEDAVSRGQATGAVRAGSPGLLARTLLLAAYGFALSARTVEGDEEALDAELAALTTRYLAP